MSSGYSYSDRQSGSFCATVDDFLDSSVSYDRSKQKDKETRNKRAERTHSPSRSRSPNERSRSTDSRSRSRDGSRRSTRSPSQKRTPTHSSSRSNSRGRNGKGSSSRSQSRSRNGTRSPSRSSSRSKSRGRRNGTRSRSQERTPRCSSSRSKSRCRNGTRGKRGTTPTPNQTRVLPEQLVLEQNGIDIDLKSLSLEAAADLILTNRPKIGGIYDEVKGNLKSIKERLKYLSRIQRTFFTDEAMEIADAAYLLRLLGKPEHEIELAGQLAHSGAILILQADMLAEKGRELLAQSKRELQLAVL